MPIEIVRGFGLLSVRGPEGSPAPTPLVAALTPAMTYHHRVVLRGRDAIDPMTGAFVPVTFERRQLYEVDDSGWLTCGAGYLARVRAAAAALGLEAAVREVGPAPPPRALEPYWENVLARFEFRYRQRECLLALASADGGIIKAPPGFGKNVIIEMFCLLYPRARIVVVTRSAAAVLKIASGLARHLPEVGVVGAGQDRVCRVTVCTADSLAKYSARGEPHALLVDEVHELMAPRYLGPLAEAGGARRFAFGASYGDRADGADAHAEGLFGPVIFEVTQQEVEAAGGTVPVRVVWHDVRLPANPADGLEGVARERWGIWRNEGRNRIVAGVARSYPDEESVLILVARAEHAVYLGSLLPGYALVFRNLAPRRRDRFVARGLLPEGFEPPRPAEIERMRRDFEAGRLRKVIATDLWAVGVSFDRLRVLVRADYRASKILDLQAPGRVARIDPATGKSVGVVHDFKDQFDPGFHRAALARRRNYAGRGWENAAADATRARRRGGPAGADATQRGER